jgi:hypothetical protein
METGRKETRGGRKEKRGEKRRKGERYLQYWYNQYFPESSGICNTHILAMTSIF